MRGEERSAAKRRGGLPEKLGQDTAIPCLLFFYFLPQDMEVRPVFAFDLILRGRLPDPALVDRRSQPHIDPPRKHSLPTKETSQRVCERDLRPPHARRSSCLASPRLPFRTTAAVTEHECFCFAPRPPPPLLLISNWLECAPPEKSRKSHKKVARALVLRETLRKETHGELRRGRGEGASD